MAPASPRNTGLLVYYERFQDVHNAIERANEIKGWPRIKEIALIVSVNPAGDDLSTGWYEWHPFQPEHVGAQGSIKLAIKLST